VNVPRFRIAWLMIAVAIAALNFAAIRAMFGSQSRELLVMGGLPMASILAVGLLIGQRRPESRPFLLGFEVFGAMAVALYVAVASYFRNEVVNPYLVLFLDPIAIIVGQDQRVKIPTLCALAVILLGWPQVVFALLGGYLSRRFKVTGIRR
jgi:hypothetical protein